MRSDGVNSLGGRERQRESLARKVEKAIMKISDMKAKGRRRRRKKNAENFSSRRPGHNHGRQKKNSRSFFPDSRASFPKDAARFGRRHGHDEDDGSREDRVAQADLCHLVREQRERARRERTHAAVRFSICLFPLFRYQRPFLSLSLNPDLFLQSTSKKKNQKKKKNRMCQFVEGVHTTLPYALAVFLVRSMSPEGSSEATIGWETGAIAACWSLAQFLTSMLWGRASDAGLGRRPLLALSALSSGLSVLAFGCSRSLLAAAAARFVGGAFNSTFTMLKCVIAESSPPGKQSGPMSILALAWGCGTIVGPALGALADPCAGSSSWVSRSPALCRSASSSSSSASSSASSASDLTSTMTSDGLFRRHPYLFPCVVAAALSALAIVNATLVLEETLPSLVERKRHQRRQQQQRGNNLLSSSSSFRSLRRVMTFSSPYALVGAGALRSGNGNGNGGGGGENENGGALELSKVEGGGGGGGAAERGGERSGLLAPSPQQRSPAPPPSSSSTTTSSPARLREQPRAPPSAFGASGDDAEKGIESSNGTPLPSPSSSPSAPSPLRQPAENPTTTSVQTITTTTMPWHQLPQVRLTLCGYGCVAFLFNLLDELVPIFSSAAEKDGGLGWQPSELAPPLAVGGVALILWSQLGYFKLQKRVGTLRAAQCGLAGMAPFCVSLAAPSLLPPGFPRSASFSLLLVLRSCFANNAFTSSMVLVNEAAPRESIGLVNGAGQTLASFVRAVGPALGGGLWGFASTSLRPPLGQFLPFFLVSLGLVASSFVYTRVLPPPGELAAMQEEEKESYRLVSSAAEAVELSSSSGFGGGVKEKAASSSPVLFDDEEEEDAAADGAVRIVVVAPASSGG